MTAQEWLDELERLREAATPGPWAPWSWTSHIYTINKRPVDPDDKKTIIAETLKENDATYIVAACNAVPRLIYMIEYLAGMLCDEEHGDNDFDGKIQDAFEMTEPKKWAL